MPKVWKPGDAKKFARQVELGKPYYIAYSVATNLAPYEDSRLYSEIVFTKRSPITGNPMSGSISAAGLCQRFGPVYDQPPAGLRSVASPGPQVAGPLPAGYEGVLDEAELRGLEKQVRDGNDPRNRRRLGGWGV